MTWKRKRLIDLFEIIGGGTPKTTIPEYWNGNIPWLSVKDFNNSDRYVYKTEKTITNSGLKNSSTKLLEKDDIIISARGTVGELAMIPYPMAFNQSCYGIRGNEEVDKTFLYYLLKNSITNLKNISHGSVFDTITRETFSNITVDIPDKDYQRKIAKFLSNLDNKIELNKRINDNLENFIKNLFKDTFYNNKSNFSYKKISLGDLMDYQGGSQPPSSEFINYKRNGYIRFIQIRDYDSNSHITYIPISSKNKICNEKDIMIARYGAALGKICCGLNGAYNVALAKVIPRKSFYREFLRNYLSSKEFYIGINNKGERSAQSGFNKSDIKSFELLFPKDEKIVIKFEKIASNCFELYLKNLKQNRTLENIRNKLLPYLISGKIDISDIELRH